jgi:hypothetical protein
LRLSLLEEAGVAPKLKYPGEMTIREAQEIENLLSVNGFVLLWSELLEDYVAFFDETRELEGMIPDKFTKYGMKELEQLDLVEMSVVERRLLNTAKRFGGVVYARGLITKIQQPQMF